MSNWIQRRGWSTNGWERYGKWHRTDNLLTTLCGVTINGDWMIGQPSVRMSDLRWWVTNGDACRRCFPTITERGRHQ